MKAIFHTGQNKQVVVEQDTVRVMPQNILAPLYRVRVVSSESKGYPYVASFDGVNQAAEYVAELITDYQY